MRTRLYSIPLVILLAPLAALDAHAQATYTLTFQANTNPPITSPSPLPLQTVSNSNPSTILTGTGQAIPGAVSMTETITTDFNLTDGANGAQSEATSSTSDFIITGPAGPASIVATFHMLATVGMVTQGGATGSAFHYAEGWVHGQAGGAPTAQGFCALENSGPISNGDLTGFSGDGTFAVDQTGLFPVGSPFSVSVDVTAGGETFGDPTVSPGTVEAVMTMRVGNANGLVMDLPEGYSVNSVSWGVTDNQFVPALAGVVGPANAALSLSIARNPSIGGRLDVRFALPSADPARLELINLAGRVLATRDVGGLGSGAHVVELEQGRRPAPGLYFVRLTQGRSTRTGKVTLLE